MGDLLTPKEILADELDPRILLKVEKLHGPVAWDYDSLVEISTHYPDNNSYYGLIKLIAHGDRSINPCGIQSYPEAITINNNNNNNNRTKYMIPRSGDCIIGIKALQPVVFEITIDHNTYLKIVMNAGEYLDDIIAGYPISLVSLPYPAVIFEFAQGSILDLELVYSYSNTLYRNCLREKKCAIPYNNPADKNNKYNIVYFYGTLRIMNQADTIKALNTKY